MDQDLNGPYINNVTGVARRPLILRPVWSKVGEPSENKLKYKWLRHDSSRECLLRKYKALSSNSSITPLSIYLSFIYLASIYLTIIDRNIIL
jgi:hypothetical protein